MAFKPYFTTDPKDKNYKKNQELFYEIYVFGIFAK